MKDLITGSLPDKPSDLLILALADLAKAESDPTYDIHMGEWHVPFRRRLKDKPTDRCRKYDHFCSVCFAGAVMAGTLGQEAGRKLIPEHFEPALHDKLQALDCFRTGDVSLGLMQLKIDVDQWTGYDKAVPYYDSDGEWRKAMNELALRLQACEL